MQNIILDFFSYNHRVILNLGDRLEQSLTARDSQILRLVSEEAERLQLPLYMVGGLPRDLVLGLGHSDFDLVVEGSAISLAQALRARHSGHVTVHRRFGTAKWNVAGIGAASAGSGELPARYRSAGLDLISARTETYPRPAHLPQVHPGTIEDDLRRRDFTINALAIRLDGAQFGQVVDPVDAIGDIQRREIHVLHEGSFLDDPTRMYRAIRYEQRLGFKIGAETLRLMVEAQRHVKALSAHRVRNELDQTLRETGAPAMIKRLSKLGLLRAIHVALPADAASLRRLASQDANPAWAEGASGLRRDTGRMWMLWLMSLAPAQIRSVRQRLEFDNRLMEELLACSRLRGSLRRLVRLRPSTMTRHLEGLPVLAVETVAGTLPEGRPRRRLVEYLGNWRNLRPHASGKDLRALGIPPGSEYRAILEKLRAAWIDGTVRSEAEEGVLLQRLVRRRIPRLSR
ncbi:MAG TPA: hypothetical protein VLL49_08225 [Anaerolineales bacterium]|nr:hypothetical protein [Anaerolineales bacterium]